MPIETSTNWILLRGLARESGHWSDFITKLQSAFPAANICPVDLPGTGVYHKHLGLENIPAITAHVRTVAQENGWLDNPVNVLGVSMGGMVALDWLLTYPQEICLGVLINISVGGLNPCYRRLRWQSLPAFIKIFLQTKMYDREMGIIQLISNRKENYETLAEEWHRIQTIHPVSINNALAQLIGAARFRVSKKPPIMPVLLLNSAGDHLVAPECSEAISKHWNLPINTHPWAGHDLITDDGDWVVEQLLKTIEN